MQLEVQNKTKRSWKCQSTLQCTCCTCTSKHYLQIVNINKGWSMVNSFTVGSFFSMWKLQFTKSMTYKKCKYLVVLLFFVISIQLITFYCSRPVLQFQTDFHITLNVQHVILIKCVCFVCNRKSLWSFWCKEHFWISCTFLQWTRGNHLSTIYCSLCALLQNYI